MTPGAWVLMLRHGHIRVRHNGEYTLSSSVLNQYTAHLLLLCSGIIMLLSYAIVDFYLFNDGVVDMQI